MRRSTTGGLVILDTNALKYLTRREDLDAVERSLRAVHLQLAPTALNVIEVIKNENADVGTRLLALLARIADGRPLLRLVTDKLRQVAEALSHGVGIVRLDVSMLEWVIYEPERLTDEHIRLAAEFRTSCRPHGLHRTSAPENTCNNESVTGAA